MKYCEKCEKVYSDDFIYCDNCGSKLKSPKMYDIFGEEMNTNDEIIKNDNNKDDYSYKGKRGEIFMYISTVSWLVPFIGSLFIFLSLFYNFVEFRTNPKGKARLHLIISFIALALSFIWATILINYGILETVE